MKSYIPFLLGHGNKLFIFSDSLQFMGTQARNSKVTFRYWSYIFSQFLISKWGSQQTITSEI
mgnify:CR=1 FL=1